MVGAFWVLVLFATATPADRALYSEDAVKPVAFQTIEECINTARPYALKAKAARMTITMQCVPGAVRDDGIIVEKDPPTFGPE